jgi:hypothetical protein
MVHRLHGHGPNTDTKAKTTIWDSTNQFLYGNTTQLLVKVSKVLDVWDKFNPFNMPSVSLEDWCKPKTNDAAISSKTSARTISHF